jgi:uncharacterized RDD family membrane protein YckC
MDILNEYTQKPAYAPLGKRYLGATIDYAIFIAIWIVMVRSFGDQETYVDGSTHWQVTGWPAFLITTLPWAILRPVIEGINDGQSIGKAIVGIRVLKMDGTKAGFDNILARHFFDFADIFPIFGIVGILVASSNQHMQRVGDLVAKTIVVNARSR